MEVPTIYNSNSKIYFNIILSLIMVIIISCGKSVPSEIERVVFEQSSFSKPISYSIPCDDSKSEKRIANYCNSKIYYGLDAAPIAFYSSSNQIHPVFLDYLLKLNLVTIKNYSTTNNYGTFHYPIMIYSKEIKKYLSNPKDDCNSWSFHIGSRKLYSIDYMNEYEAEPMGMGLKMKVYAITFSYELIIDAPNIVLNKSKFEGTAKSYLNPDNGKWILGEIHLDKNESTAMKFNTK